VVVGSFASVSEVHVASIFGVEVYRWAYCCVYIAVCFEKELQWGGGIEWELVPHLGWESCAEPLEESRNA
jgi:hypothetical protein